MTSSQNEAVQVVGEDVSSSSSSSFFRIKTPVSEGEDQGDGNLFISSDTEHDVSTIGKNIIIYETVGGEKTLITRCSLLGIIGYLSCAKKLKEVYPADKPSYDAVTKSVAHIMWPWFPLYNHMCYFDDNDVKLDPLTLGWGEFSRRLVYAEVFPNHTDEIERIVFLLKYKNAKFRPSVMHIPLNAIYNSQRLNLVAKFYIAAYRELEPDDSGLFLIDLWQGCKDLYRDIDSRPLVRPQERTPDDCKITSKFLRLLAKMEERRSRGNEDDSDSDIDNNNKGEEDDKKEEKERIERDWAAFTRMLKFIDVYEYS
ncbi:unnamed protein product [Amaranthus hypochondriacus]